MGKRLCVILSLLLCGASGLPQVLKVIEQFTTLPKYQSYLCFDSIFNYFQSIFIFKYPTIEHEAQIAEFLVQALTYITDKLSIEKLPEYSRDDARDILEELQDDLKTCKENLLRNHLLHEFRQCAHEQLEAASNKVWEFTGSINDADSSSSGFRSMFVLVIPLNVICGFIWSAISCRITSQILG